MFRITTERMVKSGFSLISYPDGRYWVLERAPGPEADRIAAICRELLPDMDEGPVRDEIVLQCDAAYRGPAVYRDGYMWNLPPRVFSEVLAGLARYFASNQKK